MNENFYKEILLKYANSLSNEYYDNYDYEIRRLKPLIKYKLIFEKLINNLIKKLGKNSLISIHHNNYFWTHIEEYEFLYNKLNDKRSKSFLVELLVYKVLGFHKVKLSLSTEDFFEQRDSVEKYKQGKDELRVDKNTLLSFYDINSMGYDIKLYFHKNGLFTDFVLQQYNYEDFIKVNKNDIVIDAGGCHGDTALYFASLGAKKVYVYEFIPSNIEVMKKNINLNEKYRQNIEIVSNPVWSESKIKFSYKDEGSSSKVGDYNSFEDKTETLSIDDLVDIKKLEKVDFIKMDIEGAEVPALKGARNTIKKYKPKLAISVYHKPDDMIVIPKLINDIRDDYKFYLDYYTIFADEIILYAI